MKSTISNGTTGIAATATSVFISVLPEVEAGLRILSLLIGVTIGLVTLWRLFKHKSQ